MVVGQDLEETDDGTFRIARRVAKDRVISTVGRDGDGTAYFSDACHSCALRAQCTNAEGGRTIRVGRYEQRLTDARAQQQDPD